MQELPGLSTKNVTVCGNSSKKIASHQILIFTMYTSKFIQNNIYAQLEIAEGKFSRILVK